MDTIPSAILEEAELKASGWASIALVAQMSPAAHAQLEACGLDAAHAAMPANDLLPLLREMVFARTIGKSEHALRLKPAEPAGQRMLRPPTVATAVDGMGTVPALVHLVVARFQEDVSWLNRLPDSVSYIVLQKHALQPEVASERQELLPNVGRESHSYLSYFLSCVNGQRSALPPTLVCCQADPFDHNPNFLSDIAALVMHAAAKQCSAYPAEEASRGEEASAADAAQTATPLRLPRFVPLGVWKVASVGYGAMPQERPIKPSWCPSPRPGGASLERAGLCRSGSHSHPARASRLTPRLSSAGPHGSSRPRWKAGCASESTQSRGMHSSACGYTYSMTTQKPPTRWRRRRNGSRDARL